jgi:hypothetical protein
MATLRPIGSFDDPADLVGGNADGAHGTGPMSKQQVSDLAVSAKRWAQAADSGASGVVVSDPSTPSDKDIYRANFSAGFIRVAGTALNFGAAADTILLGAGNWAKSFKLDGTAAAVLTADGKEYFVAFVCALLATVPTLYAVFGDEANTGAGVDLDADDIHDALDGIATIDHTVMQVIGRAKINRNAIDTIVDVFTDPAAATAEGSALLTERLHATVLSAT